MSAPSNDPVVQALQVFFSGTGYNFYDSKNTLRADDLLARQRASGLLTEGARAVAVLEGEFRRRFIPAATRENPFPPPDALESLRALGHLRARLDDLGAQILGLPAPAQDKTWWRYREEKATLARLLDFDYRLLLQCDALGRLARELIADSWRAGDRHAPLDAAFAALEAVLRERAQFLTGG